MALLSLKKVAYPLKIGVAGVWQCIFTLFRFFCLFYPQLYRKRKSLYYWCMEEPTQNPVIGSDTLEILKPKVKRDKKGRIVKGSVSLNPKGGVVGAKHMTTLLKEAIIKVANDKGDTFDKLIVKKVIDKAHKGDLHATEMIWDRMEGKVAQPVHNLNQNLPPLSSEQTENLKKLLS